MLNFDVLANVLPKNSDNTVFVILRIFSCEILFHPIDAARPEARSMDSCKIVPLTTGEMVFSVRSRRDKPYFRKYEN